METEIKIGDRVYNDKWYFEGTVTFIGPCNIPECGRYALSVDKGPVRGMYHIENFRLVASN